MTYVSVGYQWSRRALILSIVLPYILMYEARYRDDLALYYCSFNASFLLQSYAIIDPLVAWERTSSLRYALFVISSLRLLTILGMNSYYFITVPGVFYMICFGLYAVLAGILIMLCLYYIYTQYHARDHELSVFFFSICVILNACVRLIVPLAFGSPFFHKFSHMEIFYIHIISIAIASIATIMPGRIARHNGILTKLALERQKVVMRYISHEMRTPLNTIYLGVDELLRDNTKPTETLLDIQAAAELSADTLNDLIAQDDTMGQSVPLDCQEVSAYHYMRQAVTECQKHATQGNFMLQLHASTELVGYMLCVDALKLNQALRSIILVSSKMTHVLGCVTVQCDIVTDRMLTFLRIAIDNDGPSVCNGTREALLNLDILQTLHFSTGVASSLALKTAKRIIEHHGGTFEIAENNKNGVGFRTLLPLQQLQFTELSRTSDLNTLAEYSAISDRAVYINEKTGRQSACLIVDDAPVVRKMIARVVKDFFDMIYFAEDGEAAVQAVKDVPEELEIIFMDRCMPVMDGIEATREIRNMGYQGIILGVTGDALAEDVGAFVEAGADKVVTKPVRPMQFLPLIEERGTRMESSRWSVSE